MCTIATALHVRINSSHLNGDSVSFKRNRVRVEFKYVSTYPHTPKAGSAHNPTTFCAAFRFAKEPRPTPLGNIVGRASHAKREGAYT